MNIVENCTLLGSVLLTIEQNEGNKTCRISCPNLEKSVPGAGAQRLSISSYT